MAYNNDVEEITILQNGFDGLYMDYLYKKVKERFSFLPSVCRIKSEGNQTKIDFQTENAYCPYVRRFAEENIADVISVGYKYDFFDKRLKLPLLSSAEKRLFITALVAADYKDDKLQILRRVRSNGDYCLDGVFHFRLRDILRRWQGISDYVPLDMSCPSVEEFLGYLIDDGEGKVYVKDNKVYDENYKLVNKSRLTGKDSVVGEVLLSGAKRVYCFGELERNAALFLKKYYGEKAVFC